MKFQKYTLQFYVICFLLFSAPAFFYPDWFANQLGYDLTHRGAKMEFIAAYGGLILGIGIYLIYCLKMNIKLGLVCVLTVISLLFIGRLFGYAIEREINNIQVGFMVIELVSIVLASALLFASKHKCGVR